MTPILTLMSHLHFFLHINTITGAGKKNNHPNTHQTILLLFLAGSELDICHVYPQSLQTPTVARTTAVPFFPLTSPCFSRLKDMFVLLQLGHPFF